MELFRDVPIMGSPAYVTAVTQQCYVGHFAIGLAIKARHPKTPTLPIMLGVGFLDIVNGTLVILGVDQVTANIKSGPYLFFDLTFIDWDHSLLMAFVLAVAWALLFIKNNTTAAFAGLAVFSHFLADWPVHNNDLALYPHSIEHLGYGLWGRLGTISWMLEGAFAAALTTFAWKHASRRGTDLIWPAVVLLACFVQLSPWLSPMKFVARMPEPAAHMAHGTLVATGFLVPGLLLTWLINRAERSGCERPTSVGGSSGRELNGG